MLDEVEKFRSTAYSTEEFLDKNKLNQKKIIALLPGSRKQEVRVKLPLMLDACANYDDYQVLIGGAPTLDRSFYEEVIGGKEANVLYDQTYDLLNNATAALVTSGTATLETALFEVPQVVCYKGSEISYQIAKRLIKVEYISLVNLIMDEEVVCELIQNECTSERMTEELEKVLLKGNQREKCR